MSNTLKARLKVSAIAVATTITISGALVVVPQIAKAVTIDELLAQIASLQAQIQALSGSSSVGVKTGLNLTADLVPGARGQAVTDLQTALKSDTALYPEGIVSGFYGALTTKAVQRFQAKYGIASAGTPSTTGYGRVGPKTRAKLNEVFGGTSTTPPTTPGTTPTGSGVSVSAATQPAETLAVENAARLPFVRLTLTASNDGDVVVNGITVKREGLADDAIFDGIILIDEDGQQVGNSKTLNSNHQATLDGKLTVKRGTSKTVTVAGNMVASLDSYAGQVVKLSVVAVNAGTATVSGSLPITSNNMTVNGSLTIGSATMTRGAVDPGATATKPVGTKAYTFSAVKLTAGSAEDVVVKSIRFDQAGSASDTDLKNVKIVAGGTEYEAKTDGKKYWAAFGDGISVAKGANLEISIKGDVESGSSRTVDLNVDKKQDIVVLGKLYGYYLTPSGGSAGAASAGSFSSNQEPFYNAYAVTIDTGTLRAEKSNSVAAGNAAVEISNVDLGAFTFEAKGEEAQVTNMVLNFTFTGTGSSSNITSVRLVDSSGAVVAGPKDPASGIVTFTDTWNIPVGMQTYKVQGKLSSTFVSNDTVVVSVTPGNMTVKGQTTGKTITATPSTAISGNTQTVRAAALKVSLASSPVAQNVVRGVNGFLFSKFQYDATNSGEDIRITSQAITVTTAASGDPDDLANCQVFDGTTALNTGSNVTNPTGATGATTYTVTFDNHLIVPKGTTKTVDVKCNISGNFTADGTVAIGIAAAQDTAATGVTTGNSVTETLVANTGVVMTVKSGGSFTVAKDSSSPTERWGIAGSADQVATVFKLSATNEAMRLDRFHVQFNSNTASSTDFSKVTLWDGATKVGEAVFTGSDAVATSTLTSDFIIPKDGDKLLTAKVDLAAVGTSQSGAAGRLVRIDYDGGATTSTRAIGQSSGTAFNSGTTADVTGDGIRLAKSYPTLARLSVPSSTLTNGTMTLYRFSVTAPSAGDVGLYKFTFDVSSTTVATTTNFYVYGYSDASFSVQAYANNPLNARQVDIVGENSNDDVGFLPAASTTEVAVYFDPVTANAGAPNAEAINVPAGTTRFFELRATVSRATAGDAINVSLLGDAAYFDRTSTRFMESANTVDVQTTNNDFIWSPNTTTTSATTSVDWANGFRLPGLPSTNMEQQTFSK